MEKKKLLVFHPTIAPYRIDFFNDLYEAFDTKICLQYKNLKSQKFDYDKISSQFQFEPQYLSEDGRCALIKDVKKHIKAYDPDVVITCEFNIITIIALLWRFIARKKYRLVVMCDDSFDMVLGGRDFSAKHKYARNFLSYFIDELILVDIDVQKWYQKKYKKGVFFPIIKNEYTARKLYQQALYLRSSVLEQYKLNGKNVFLFVGRLVPIKNVDTVIKAFSCLDQNKNVLVIVGSGPEEEKLKDLAKEFKINSVFTGRLEGDMLNVWYVIADCFVLASYIEPFGAVTNEALLAGCRCLISEKAGSRCLVKNGKNGFVFSPNNIEELKEDMKMINQMSSLDLSSDGLRQSQMLISYDNYIENLKNVINRL